MRTLKFRCFDNKSNKMIENCSHVQREGIEIMQFTGLLDRHGVEIYEGDIVKQYQTSRGHVYAKQHLRVVKYVNAAHNTGFNIAERGTHRTEVIGNIYEHAHLLEVNQ